MHTKDFSRVWSAEHHSTLRTRLDRKPSLARHSNDRIATTVLGLTPPSGSNLVSRTRCRRLANSNHHTAGMKLKFYGTRGSVPVCDAGFQQFGGNTTCFQITFTDINQIAVVDAGTGIRKLGRDLQMVGHKQEQIILAFTHFHWDHIQGFPFFAPAYEPNQEITLLTVGEGQTVKDLRGIFETQMQSVFFPVQLEHMGASFRFVQVQKDTEHFKSFIEVASVI